MTCAMSIVCGVNFTTQHERPQKFPQNFHANRMQIAGMWTLLLLLALGAGATSSEILGAAHQQEAEEAEVNLCHRH